LKIGWCGLLMANFFIKIEQHYLLIGQFTFKSNCLMVIHGQSSKFSKFNWACQNHVYRLSPVNQSLRLHQMHSTIWTVLFCIMRWTYPPPLMWVYCRHILGTFNYPNNICEKNLVKTSCKTLIGFWLMLTCYGGY
jgi:hypothetical protein